MDTEPDYIKQACAGKPRKETEDMICFLIHCYLKSKTKDEIIDMLEEEYLFESNVDMLVLGYYTMNKIDQYHKKARKENLDIKLRNLYSQFLSSSIYANDPNFFDSIKFTQYKDLNNPEQIK